LVLDPEFAGLFGPLDQQAAHDNLVRVGVVARSESQQVASRQMQPPDIARYTVDLSEGGAGGRNRLAFGRDAEVEQVVRWLESDGQTRGVFIYGKKGTGLSSVLNSVATRVDAQEINVVLLASEEPQPGSIINEIVERAIASDRVVVIRSLDPLLDEDFWGSSAIYAIKSALNLEGARIVLGTSSIEVRRKVQSDDVLSDRLRSMSLGPWTVAQTCDALTQGGLLPGQELGGVEIEPTAIDAACRLAERHIRDRALPGSAVAILNAAREDAHLGDLASHAEVTEAHGEIERLGGARKAALLDPPPRAAVDAARDLAGHEWKQYLTALDNKNFEAAAEIRNEGDLDLLQLITRSTGRPGFQRLEAGGGSGLVDYEAVVRATSMLTGTPIGYVGIGGRDRVSDLRRRLAGGVVGQHAAVEVVYQQLLISLSGFHAGDRPIANLMFLGPTGVGKTEMARVMAEIVSGSAASIVRLDMSEFQESHTVSKLIGSPPGYVGYATGGHLTEAVSENPYSVVLLDEIEKACDEVHLVLLQTMDDGRLTDGSGKTVDFTNTAIVMTSNMTPEAMERKFPPEWRNRLDSVVQFEPLARDEIALLVDRMVDKETRVARDQGFQLGISDELRDALVDESSGTEFGARPLRRNVRKRVLVPFVEFWSANTEVDSAPETDHRIEIGLTEPLVKVIQAAARDQAETNLGPVLAQAVDEGWRKKKVFQPEPPEEVEVYYAAERLFWSQVSTTARADVDSDEPKDFGPAIDLYERALEMQPTWAGLRMGLGRAYAFNKQSTRCRTVIAPVWSMRHEEMSKGHRVQLYLCRLVLHRTECEIFGEAREVACSALSAVNVLDEVESEPSLVWTARESKARQKALEAIIRCCATAKGRSDRITAATISTIETRLEEHRKRAA
jgi:ATP-dependent Clp protease ATP-binding subunit ClpC